MPDSASLIVRVSGQGVDSTAKSLDGLTIASGRADKAASSLSSTSDKAARPVSGFGYKAQQAGYQIQDMVVQLQGGTSAFVAIGQQVPQFLGAFGPMGAIVGTVVALGSAIGGVLYKSMGNSTDAAGDLKKELKDLNEIITESDDGVVNLTEKIVKLAQANEQAANAELALGIVKAAEAINSASQVITDASKAADGWTNSTGKLANAANQLDELDSITKRFGITQEEAFNGEIPAFFQDKIDSLSTYINTLGKEFGLTTSESLKFISAASEFNNQPTPERAAELSSVLDQIVASNQNLTPEFIKLTVQIDENARIIENASEKTKTLGDMQQNLSKYVAQATAEISKQNASTLENLRIATLSGAEQIKAKAEQQKKELENNKTFSDADLKQAKDLVDKKAAMDIKEMNDRESLRDQKHSVALEKQDKRDAERLQRQKDAAQKFLDETKQGGMNELDAIDAKETEKLTKLNDYHNRDLISEKQYQDGKLAIQQEANKKREDLLIQQLEKEQQQRDQYQQFIDPINQDGMSEIAVIEAQQEEELRTLQDYKNKKIINEQEYADAVRKIQEQTERKKNDVYLDGLSTMTDNLKTALGENNALYKAAAITQTIIDTYKGAQAAFTSLATIPVVGPALGTAAAAAAIGAGMARVAAIKSAREQGGYMTSGSAYQMAERGKAEIITPAGMSRARTVSQIQQMMGQSSSGIKGVTIINNTTGRIDNATTEVDNEGMLRVLIDEHVSSQLMTQDSPIAKARRSTAGQPGY